MAHAFEHTALSHSGLCRRGHHSQLANREHWKLFSFLENTGACGSKQPCALTDGWEKRHSCEGQNKSLLSVTHILCIHTHIYGNLTHIYIVSSNTQEKFPATNTVDAPKIAVEHTMCCTFSSLSLESAYWEYNSVCFPLCFLPLLPQGTNTQI